MLPALLTGQRFENVERRGKYLLLELDSGDELMVHLGMTGHLLVCDADAPVAKHTHIRAALDDGRELRFDDARRFGRVAYGSREALTAARVLPRLGVEPLSDAFSQERLDAVLRTTTRTVKAALLDQKGVAGLGQHLHRRGVFPGGSAADAALPPPDPPRASGAARRHPARAHAQRSANRGSSVDDYRDVWNARGQQPGAPPGVRARRPALLSVRHDPAPHHRPPVAPPCTARTASDDPGHHRQLRRRSAARRPGRRGARDARGAGAARGARAHDLGSRRARDRASLDAPAGHRSTSRCSSTGTRGSCSAPHPTSSMRRVARAECCSGNGSAHRSSTPRITPTVRRTGVDRSSACSTASRRAPTVAPRWCCRCRAPPRTRCSRWAIPASRIEVLSNGVDAVDLPDVAARGRSGAVRQPHGAREGGARGDLGAPGAHRVGSTGARRHGRRRQPRGRRAARGAASGGRIEYLGALDREALNREYARAAVVVMPSRFEGLGMVALEAQAAGTPVVGFDVDGLRDAVGVRRRARCRRRPDRAAAAVDGAARTTTPAAPRPGARGREVVLAEHSWDAIGGAPRGDLRGGDLSRIRRESGSD